MNSSISCNTFNSLAVDNLCRNGFCIGDVLFAGVSGGADSICLLTSIAEGIEDRLADCSASQTINVITVNHRIRSEEESGGDCDFVKSYCKELNDRLSKVKITCIVEELKKGQVLHTEEIRKRGTEEAARFLRYQEFEKNAGAALDLLETSDSSGSRNVFFALAHNQNDQLETLVMRFLSGSGANSRGGIAESRSVKLKNGSLIYVRPLLDVSRLEIENYLKQKNINWRTDSTNSDNNYLRNNIRNSIIPVLDKNFKGWKTAVLTGREKACRENSFIEKSIENLNWNESEEGVSIDLGIFEKLEFVQKEHLLYKGFEILGEGGRIPYSFVKQIALKNYNLCKNGVEASVKEGILWLKKLKNNVTIYGFFDIIEEDGIFDFDFGRLYVKTSENGFAELQFVTNEAQNYYLNNVKLPFVFRSRQLSDTVLTKSKENKSVSDVLSDFKVDAGHKNLIPVIQSLDDDGSNNIIAVWGELFGYSNWIV